MPTASTPAASSQTLYCGTLLDSDGVIVTASEDDPGRRFTPTIPWDDVCAWAESTLREYVHGGEIQRVELDELNEQNYAITEFTVRMPSGKLAPFTARVCGWDGDPRA